VGSGVKLGTAKTLLGFQCLAKSLLEDSGWAEGGGAILALRMAGHLEFSLVGVASRSYKTAKIGPRRNPGATASIMRISQD